jgi:alkyl sulfatase BDS1-like metallo-beta-lactamase superfamily hydrolase
VIGDVAKERIAEAQQESGHQKTHGSAVDLIHDPIELKTIRDGIYYAQGVGNVYMITTDEGNVVFDTGLILQAGKQLKLLEEVANGKPTRYVVVSHSHADHEGGANLWKAEGTDIVAHKEFEEEQRYLRELEPYLHGRNRTLFPWIPATPPDLGPLNYGNVHPTITVDEGRDFEFELGGKKFVVMATPGAEGADNISLWMPEEKLLFSGDFFGPQFPQFPNVFTMRGEKVRKPIEYIHSLNRIIELQPEGVLPAHFGPTWGKDDIQAKLVKIRDAVQYVHDAIVVGMNSGKTVYELMEEIQLPPELDLPQNHGRVSWAVKSIWEYYATWFHFDDTSELYAVAPNAVNADLAEMVDAAALLQRAEDYLKNDQPVHALKLVNVLLAAGDREDALRLRLDILNQLKDAAEAGLKNDYEIYWLNARIRDTSIRIDG